MRAGRTVATAISDGSRRGTGGSDFSRCRPKRASRQSTTTLEAIGTDPFLTTGWVLSMDSIWQDPTYAEFVERLAAFSRVDPVGQAGDRAL